MLTVRELSSRFGTRPLFGMIHLEPLPGAPLYGGTLSPVIDAAVRDALALREGGLGVLMFENFGDRPFFKSFVPAETVAAMTRVITEVVREVALPFGVNVLRNDVSSALAVAAATGAAFVRVNVLTGAVVADQGVIEGEAAAVMRRRAALCPGVLVFADHRVKHARPLVEDDEVQNAKDLRLRALADAVILSGSETGSAVDPSAFEKLKRAVGGDTPLLIGSGLSAANAASLREVADGAIVGTSVKAGGDVSRAVDPARVRELVSAWSG